MILANAWGLSGEHTGGVIEGGVVSKRSRKIKATSAGRPDNEVFWMSLEEAKRAIADKYEFLAERYERRYPRDKLS